MKRVIRIIASFVFLFVLTSSVHAQNPRPYYAGFKALKLTDSSRIYKPHTDGSDSLHYRPVELDIWYPATEKSKNKLSFGDLFGLLEQRANRYQHTDYTGLTQELIQYWAIESGLEVTDGAALLQAPTNSYLDAVQTPQKSPLIFYMAGLNGMGFENAKMIERLAENGFVVVSIWSVGRYPGNMTNQKDDMMEQVYDAEFALRYLKLQTGLSIDFSNTGLLGCSWGGMSAAVLQHRNPNITAFVSLDGTETHYFGESEEDDSHINAIHNSNMFAPQQSDFSYLYMESDNKLESFTPSEEYHFFKKLNSKKKYYMRVSGSRHEDFTSIPSFLKTSQQATERYDLITESALTFFQQELQKKNVFNPYYNNLAHSEKISPTTLLFRPDTGGTIVIQGKVLDSKSGESLTFVNVGVLNREVGTVTDSLGMYKLHLRDEMQNDTIRMSMIGYKPTTIRVSELLSKHGNEIRLEEDIRELNEVIITARDMKKKNVGNRTTSRFMSAGFGYNQLGAEMGIKIKIKSAPTYADTFNFNISYNRLSAKTLFRLNIYEIQNGKPSNNILKENIIIPIEPKQTGLISIDLKRYDIVLQQDVIATLEWVKSEGENLKGEGIFFSLGLLNNNGTWVKLASQGKFKKHGSMGVGMNFDVRE